MKAKLVSVFLASLVVGAVANWVSVKFTWWANNAKNESAVAKSEQVQGVNPDVSEPIAPWRVAGVTVSPSSTDVETRPSEITVSFPFTPEAGGLTVLFEDNQLVGPSDDLVIRRDQAFVFPLPATASSGVYTVNFTGCPNNSIDEDCITGAFGFTVK